MSKTKEYTIAEIAQKITENKRLSFDKLMTVMEADKNFTKQLIKKDTLNKLSERFPYLQLDIKQLEVIVQFTTAELSFGKFMASEKNYSDNKKVLDKMKSMLAGSIFDKLYAYTYMFALKDDVLANKDIYMKDFYKFNTELLTLFCNDFSSYNILTRSKLYSAIKHLQLTYYSRFGYKLKSNDENLNTQFKECCQNIQAELYKLIEAAMDADDSKDSKKK